MIQLDTPIQFVKGVGPGRAQDFAKAGLEMVADLLAYRPFRYEDRTRFRQVRGLRPGEEALLFGQIVAAGLHQTSRRRFSIFELMLQDESGVIPVKFFNQPYLEKIFERGQSVILFGMARLDSYSKRVAILNPDFELVDSADDRTIHTARIVPVYRRVGLLSTRVLRQIMANLLEHLDPEIEDPLPAVLQRRYRFPKRRRAFQLLHFPELPADVNRDRFLSQLAAEATPSQRRFIYEEFFQFQLGLEVVRKRRELVPKPRRIRVSEQIRSALKAILPFHPTAAQKKVLAEIVKDLCSERVMSRLLQGDVGSGKTIVALQALVVVIENGYQTALMAPTEILAGQHYRTIFGYLTDTRYRVEFLSSAVKGRARKKILDAVGRGEVDLLIGTHALIQEAVRFDRLAMVVVDEQHRFGVVQRSQLMEKGNRPDTLVMTATPIPRSLALTVYGDLDFSLLDELPPGRQPIRTVIKTDSNRSSVYSLLRAELKKGRQAYVVYPLVEESETVDLKAATEMAAHLKRDVFPDFRVGLIHGRLEAGEKESLMHEFKSGELAVLVATTVIEVGIDVANASVMVIEHAERFGLSQLHQLRGRVGRGRHPGICILLVERVRSRDAYQRLEIMRQTSDGFKIAERDLEIRGPGEFVGTRQSGLPEFRFGNIVRDRNLLEQARGDARQHLHALVKASPHAPQILEKVARDWKRHFGLFEVG